MLTQTNSAFAGLIGGWVAVMTPAVLIIALKMREFEESGQPNMLAVTLLTGWLALMVALVVMGRLSDQLFMRTGSRIALIRTGAPLLVLVSCGLAFSSSSRWLTVAWILAQIPAAMIITTALAVGGGVAQMQKRGLISGLLGAAPIIGLLFGSVMVGVLTTNTSIMFVLTALFGALLSVPLMLTKATQQNREPEDVPRRVADHNAHALLWVWVLFLFASFLLSWTTSTTNTFVVEFISQAIQDTDSNISTIASIAVAVASSAAIISSISFGTLAKNSRRAQFTWIAGAAISATSIFLLSSAESTLVIYIAALLFGIGFGAANGVEVSITLVARPQVNELGQNLGLLNAITSAPYILVPAIAALVWQSADGYKVGPMFLISAVTALLGAVIFIAAKLPRTESQLMK